MSGAKSEIRGRFAPSPSGRMHLGNVYSALFSYFCAKENDGEWILRIEDLDRQRCKKEYSSQLIDDLLWLGLTWDNFSNQNDGLSPDFFQSNRESYYIEAFDSLYAQNLVYDCFCSRADIQASSAPHLSDGKIVYSGKCKNLTEVERHNLQKIRNPAKRLSCENKMISFTDRFFGRQECNVSKDCGDFIIRRGDGNFAYQLAVVVDDELMDVNQIVRGRDLISSTFEQVYLYEKLNFKNLPNYVHLPLLASRDGRRLSKRDKDCDMGFFRENFTAEEVIGKILSLCGLLPKEEKISVADAVSIFDLKKLPKNDIRVEKL